MSQAADGGLGIHSVEATVVAALRYTGLPVDGVLADMAEREAVAVNFTRPLARLDPQRISQSLYLSKFFAAVVAGPVRRGTELPVGRDPSPSLRRVCGYDLAYFVALAVNDPSRRNKLQTEADHKKSKTPSH